ncbi:hypothetical protein ACMA1D_13600 [Streptomyces sp. 796.1]|uniref:hypothetical protein n=1 Tax=Streptomyces sp. 796.1 TaxID=3163029 RepID=UPI0039C93E75
MTKGIAAHAVTLLQDAGQLAGRKYAIGAMAAATALRQPGPVTVLTSDTEDLRMLCGKALTTTKV